MRMFASATWSPQASFEKSCCFVHDCVPSARVRSGAGQRDTQEAGAHISSFHRCGGGDSTARAVDGAGTWPYTVAMRHVPCDTCDMCDMCDTCDTCDACVCRGRLRPGSPRAAHVRVLTTALLHVPVPPATYATPVAGSMSLPSASTASSLISNVVPWSMVYVVDEAVHGVGCV